MATTFNISSRTYNPGSQTFGPFAVPVGITHIQIIIDRTGWVGTDPHEIAKIEINASFDGGLTFGLYASMGVADDSPINPATHSVATQSSLDTDLQSNITHLRAIVTVTRTVTTAITINLT